MSEHVAWDVKEQDPAWLRTIRASDGTALYALTLRPLSTLEGEVVAFSVSLASIAKPDENLLDRPGHMCYAYIGPLDPADPRSIRCAREKHFRVGGVHGFTLHLTDIAVQTDGACPHCPGIRRIELDVRVAPALRGKARPRP